MSAVDNGSICVDASTTCQDKMIDNRKVAVKVKAVLLLINNSNPHKDLMENVSHFSNQWDTTMTTDGLKSY